MSAEPSFIRLVLRQAFANSWELFRHRIFDAVLAVFSLAIGGGVFWLLHGWSAVKERFIDFGVYAIAPAGVFVFIIVIWNLFFAPLQLIYEEIKGGMPRALLPKTPIPIKWEIWKQRSEYTVDEFAAILAGNDPVLSMTAEAASYRRLLFEDMEANRVPHEIEYDVSLEGGRYKKGVNGNTKITRFNAVRWAEIHGFDVSHIRTA